MMLEGLFENGAKEWSSYIGAITATIAFAIAFKKNGLKYLYSPIKLGLKERKDLKREKYINDLFVELLPMINTHIEKRWEVGRGLMRDQSITLDAAISESIEFNNIVNKKIELLQEDGKETRMVIEKNSQVINKIYTILKDSGMGAQ